MTSELREETPWPMWGSFSSTSTVKPRRDSARLQASPTAPAPTTVASKSKGAPMVLPLAVESLGSALETLDQLVDRPVEVRLKHHVQHARLEGEVDGEFQARSLRMRMELPAVLQVLERAADQADLDLGRVHVMTHPGRELLGQECESDPGDRKSTRLNS